MMIIWYKRLVLGLGMMGGVGGGVQNYLSVSKIFNFSIVVYPYGFQIYFARYSHENYGRISWPTTVISIRYLIIPEITPLPLVTNIDPQISGKINGKPTFASSPHRICRSNVRSIWHFNPNGSSVSTHVGTSDGCPVGSAVGNQVGFSVAYLYRTLGN